MRRLDKPIWIHPTRGANFPDYLDEKKSLYEIWWTFGWSYETAAAMARLVFSKTLDNNPGLKLVMHHFGGIVPMVEGRIGPGWDQIGARTSDATWRAATGAKSSSSITAGLPRSRTRTGSGTKVWSSSMRRCGIRSGSRPQTNLSSVWIKRVQRLERDDFSSNRHPALASCLSMIFSENRCPLFGIML
jgi:hypothetical protein